MQVANAAAWACPKCFAITKEGGQCAKDQTDKVQLGSYYCRHCIKATGIKPGKCTTFAAPAVQMTVSYVPNSSTIQKQRQLN
jgi:hypothetical protein